MQTIIKKFKVKKVVRSGNCQELFYWDELKTLTSIKIIRIKKDIASMLKKSFLGRCKSEIEIHYLGDYPIKLILDGTLIGELKEENYPKGLKLLLAKEVEYGKAVSQKLQLVLESYPLRNNLEVEPFSLDSILLRAYACAIFDKLSNSKTSDQNLNLRRCALIFDLLKIVDQHKAPFIPSFSLPILLDIKDFWQWCYPYKSPKDFVQTFNLQGLMNVDEQVLRYLCCWISDLAKRFQEDYQNLKDFILEKYALLSDQQLDRQLIMQYDKPLNICLPFSSLPDFLMEEPLSVPELKHSLSKQNW